MRVDTKFSVFGRRRGVTLIEAAMTLGIIAILMVGLTQLLSGAAETSRARAVADRLQQVTAASKAYLQANFPDLIDITPVGTVTQVPVVGTAGPAGATALGSLQSAGFLPSTFADTNAFNQDHVLLLKRPPGATDRLDGVITTRGGSVIPDRILGQISSIVGAEGGFMMATPPASGAAGTIYGTSGGWSAPATDWGSIPTVGRVMSAISSNEGALAGDYLSRNNIGIAEANRMRTNIDMAGNDVNNVTNLNGVKNITGIGPDKVTIGPDLSVLGYITAGTNITAVAAISAGTDITAGRNVTASGRVQGGTVNSLTSVAATTDVTAGGNVTAGGGVTAAGQVQGGNLNSLSTIRAGTDITALGNISAAGRVDGSSVESGTHVRGTRFIDRDNNSYVLDPNGNSNLLNVTVNDTLNANTANVTNLNSNRLATNYLNVDALIYQRDGGGPNPLGTTLRDRLPNYVMKGGYQLTGYTRVIPNVPMPVCGTGGSPKITMTPLTDSMRFYTNVSLYGSVDNINVSNGEVAIARGYQAFDQGDGRWRVENSGTEINEENGWKIFAMTYCYYP